MLVTDHAGYTEKSYFSSMQPGLSVAKPGVMTCCHADVECCCCFQIDCRPVLFDMSFGSHSITPSGAIAMKQLNEAEMDFIDRRRQLVRWWPLVLLFTLLLLAGTWLFLFLKHPALANASFVIDAVSADTLSADIMQLSAVFLPIVISVLFFVLAVMLLFLHQSIRNERRYQFIIRNLCQPATGAGAVDRITGKR